MSDSKSNRPVLIKRKIVKAAESHHSGAWKVAYADFVTAMMAFFLLMWLLNATSEDQRQGLADYFNPTIKITRSSGGGEGVLGGETMMSDQNHVKMGSGGLTELEAGSAQTPDGFGATAEAIELKKIVEEELFARGGESRTMEQLLRHVITRVTDEGLVIELFDLDNARLFEEDSATPTSESIVLSGLITNVINRTGFVA